MTINWTLKDVNEANAILAVLGKLPYEQVGELIPRLRDETQRQLTPAPQLRAVPDSPVD